MTASSNGFIEDVARARGLLLTRTGAHTARLQPAGEPPAWYCDLDDGTPTGESDPASSVRWVSPALRTLHPAGSPILDVRRVGPQSDLGRIGAWIGRLAGRSSSAAAEGRYAYADPHGILDDQLRHRVEHWPDAAHGDGIVRPAELWSMQVTREGLVVTSVSWWGSAPALDHQIALAVDVAARLTARRDG
ncbi:hypothetical protein [Cellulomonas sp.]|uniref:hypothetical protein n=1 Tax=Cellulomonas sp. TaxID=40001 RepID=UPI003BAB6544